MKKMDRISQLTKLKKIYESLCDESQTPTIDKKYRQVLKTLCRSLMHYVASSYIEEKIEKKFGSQLSKLEKDFIKILEKGKV